MIHRLWNDGIMKTLFTFATDFMKTAETTYQFYCTLRMMCMLMLLG